jgi:NAD(P)-dependent dehydrogenase (short-subunit alcohol dehydrogenase family)
VVTGGSRGIGRAIALRLAAEGAAVAVNYATNAAAADEVVATVRAAGGDAFAVRADIGDRPKIAAMFAAIDAELARRGRDGRIDVLVNNAGANVKNRALKEMDPATWDRQVAVNLNSVFYCMHAVLPQMRERGAGLVINISSTSGKRAGPLGGAAYSAAKFGVAALGICAGVEERDVGIRVTTIFPGEVDTPILVNRPTPPTEEHRAKILRPEDVAEAVAFVAALPPRAHVPELIIKPATQVYV